MGIYKYYYIPSEIRGKLVALKKLGWLFSYDNINASIKMGTPIKIHYC